MSFTVIMMKLTKQEILVNKNQILKLRNIKILALAVVSRYGSDPPFGALETIIRYLI